jgi:hypothetical protein
MTRTSTCHKYCIIFTSVSCSQCLSCCIISFGRCSDLLALEYVDADETSFPPNGNVTSVSSASRTGLSAAHAVLRAGSRSSSASATSRQSVDNSVNNNNERTTSSAATTRREPFLPSINPVGCLSTRRPSSSESRQNGERRSNAGIDRQRSSEFRTASNAWNSPTASNVWNSPAMSTDTRDASVSLPAHDIGIGSFRR